MIVVEQAHKWFGRHHVLRGINLRVERGEVLVVIGPSGSGKTTLLRCLNYLVPLDRGRVLIDGEPLGHHVENGVLKRDPARVLDRKRRQIGMVFQHFNFFPHLTVLGTPGARLVPDQPERVKMSTRGPLRRS